MGWMQGKGHEAFADSAAPMRPRYKLLPHVASLVEADALQCVQVVLEGNGFTCAQDLCHPIAHLLAMPRVNTPSQDIESIQPAGK